MISKEELLELLEDIYEDYEEALQRVEDEYGVNAYYRRRFNSFGKKIKKFRKEIDNE